MTRRGMTLVEMLVAMTATLVLMAAVVQVFATFGTAVTGSRAVSELDSQMRAVAWRLRSDLTGATAATQPPLTPAGNEGYFEIIEGPNTDTVTVFDPVPEPNGFIPSPAFDKTGTTPGPTAASDDRILGDTDDVLLFTTRSSGEPFRGRFQNSTYESTAAEVAWFLRPIRANGAQATVNPVVYALYRRQLLVVGYVGAAPFLNDDNMLASTTLPGAASNWQRFFSQYDLSVRAAQSGGGLTFMPNTLGDLTRREARFLHNVAAVTDGSGFPYAFPSSFQGEAPPDGLTFAGTTREDQDVVLTNVIGFDVRVFDPTSPVQASGTSVVVPGDPGFNTAATSQANGAYVDLGHGVTAPGPCNRAVRFSTFGYARSQLAATTGNPRRTWDTWSTHYETDGFDQDNVLGIDQGSNGLDDDGNGVVDDGPADLDGNGSFTSPGEMGELETSPPYPYPLRGIEVRIRCYEQESRQVRQVTVRHTFVPH
jgi:prepilin-type N-terminal cleavage/methylation domain-containing protein